MRFRERLDIKYLWIYVAYYYDKSFFRKSIDETQSRLKIRMNSIIIVAFFTIDKKYRKKRKKSLWNI